MPASVSSITSLVTHASRVLADTKPVWGKVIFLANPIGVAITAAIHLSGEFSIPQISKYFRYKHQGVMASFSRWSRRCGCYVRKLLQLINRRKEALQKPLF